MKTRPCARVGGRSGGKKAPGPKSARGGEKPPRVAVILCGCRGEISGRLDMDALARRIEANRKVAMTVRGDCPCSKTGIQLLAGALAKGRVERVVVAGCSERLFGRHFRAHLGGLGLHPAFIEFADVRSNCAAAGARSRTEVTGAAARLVARVVESVVGAPKSEAIEAEVLPVCAVLGGGVAGVTAAVALAARGVEVVLIEKEGDLGGLVKKLNVVYPNYVASSDFVRAKREELARSGARVIIGQHPVAVKGHVGEFEIALSGGESVKAGVIIVATGADLLVPTGLFGYGENSRVITQMELEAILSRGEVPGRNIVMIQCAGSRNAERPYCSRVCCTASIVNTIVIKQRSPETKITVLSRGFAEYAGDLDKARQMGVEIIRYSPERPPAVKGSTVEVYDEISEMETHIPYDLVVLAVPMVASQATRDLAALLKMPADRFGFIVEPHLRVRPEEAAPRGIFAAGCAHWPSTITESIVQAYSAASRAFDLVHAGKIVRETVPAAIDRNLCRGCARCLEACRHGAIDLVTAEDGLKRAEVVAVQCTGCGVCVSVCPSGAAAVPGTSAEAMTEVVDAMTGG